MIKLLVREREYRSTTNFPKIPLWPLYIGLQSQKFFFDLFFDREQQSKNYFLHYKPCLLTSLSSRKSCRDICIIYRKNRFSDFFILQFKGTSFSSNNSRRSTPIKQQSVIFFEFLIVELTILRLHFFDLGLILRNF